MSDMLPGEVLVQLPCFKTHIIHKSCYENAIKFAQDNRKPLKCPLCRKPFTKSNVRNVKVTINKPKGPEMEQNSPRAPIKEAEIELIAPQP